MGLTLHSHPHSHGSSGSHKHGNDENINVRAAFIHVLSDFVQSCGVFLAALVIYFKPEWNIIDPICTFVFSVLVLATTIAIMKDALMVSCSFVDVAICKLRNLIFNRIHLYFTLHELFSAPIKVDGFLSLSK